MLFYTSAGGGGKQHVEAFIEGAELNGFIVVTSVESSNSNDPLKNYFSVSRCGNHLLAKLPVDSNRDYFSGHSGGGSMASVNNSIMSGEGCAPIIGYNPYQNKLSQTSLYYVMGGATDYNRYMSADVAHAAKDRGFHRIYPGGHQGAPQWMLTEATIFFNARFLKSKSSDRAFAQERIDWEENMIEWITKLKEKEPHRAYYWCLFLEKDYRASGPNATRIAAITKELAKDSVNTRYAQGIDDINEFSKKYYTGHGFGSKFDHGTAQMQSAAAELQRKYAGVPFIEDVAKEIGNKTGGKKK